MGVLFPEEYGGAGMGYVEYATIIEEIGRVCGSVGLSVAAHNSLCSNHIYTFGNEEQKKKYLVPLAQRRKLWSVGSDRIAGRFGRFSEREPPPFAQTAAGRSTAQRISLLTRSHAIRLSPSPSPTKQKAIAEFRLSSSTNRWKAFVPIIKENKLGMRASETASVVFEDCYVPDENRLGNEGEGFMQAMQVLDGGRISIAALSVGIAQGAYEAAVKYAKERQQFGKPIAEFQAIQFKLADMATQIECARLLTLQAAATKDAGKPVTQKSAMAKLYASEAAVRVSEESVQIHGGYGYTKDYPAEKYWRDSKLCTIGEGTSEIQRLVIAKNVLKSM